MTESTNGAVTDGDVRAADVEVSVVGSPEVGWPPPSFSFPRDPTPNFLMEWAMQDLFERSNPLSYLGASSS